MKTLTTTIKREFLRQIVLGEKHVEYRDIKPYWEQRLERMELPFKLRLINGMTPNAPEATVEITRVVRNKRSGEFELHIGRVFKMKNCKTLVNDARGAGRSE